MLAKFIGNRLPGIMVASVPFAGWSFFNIGSTFAFSASYVVGLVALVLNFPKLVTFSYCSGNRNFLEFYAPLIFSCLFSGFLLGFWEFSDAWQYIASLLHLCFFILITYSLLQVRDYAEALNFYAKTCIFIGLFVAIIGLIDFVLVLQTGYGLGIEFNTVARTMPSTTTIGQLPRASSIFFEPGWFAHYLLISITIVVTWILPLNISSRKWWRVGLLCIGVLIMLMAMIATLSAATYFVFGVLIFFYVLNRPYPLRDFGIVLIVLFFISMIPLPYDLQNPIAATFERFVGLMTSNPVSGESIDTRKSELNAAFQMFTDTFLLGAGYGQSAYYISSVTDIGTGGISSFYGVLMAETGLIGLLFFITSILLLNYKLWHLHKVLKRQSIEKAQIVFCAQCVILAETVYLNFISAMASATYVTSFWFALLILNAWGGTGVNFNHLKKV